MCKKCGEFKSLDDFGNNARWNDGRTRRCLICVRREQEERFWGYVNKDGAWMSHMTTNCWEWTGLINHNGYGLFHVGGKSGNVRVHRYAYVLYYGEIPDLPGTDWRGTCVLHICDNRRCVRGEHLKIGTQYDNVQDAVEKNRQIKGDDFVNSKLTCEKVRELRELFNLGYSYKELSQMFGVDFSVIGRAIRRETWKHVK